MRIEFPPIPTKEMIDRATMAKRQELIRLRWREVMAELDKLARAFKRVQNETRAFSAAMRGQHELAEVIRTQPGVQIVRDGMPEILHWLRECRCYQKCDYAKEN